MNLFTAGLEGSNAGHNAADVVRSYGASVRQLTSERESTHDKDKLTLSFNDFAARTKDQATSIDSLLTDHVVAANQMQDGAASMGLPFLSQLLMIPDMKSLYETMGRFVSNLESTKRTLERESAEEVHGPLGEAKSHAAQSTDVLLKSVSQYRESVGDLIARSGA